MSFKTSVCMMQAEFAVKMKEPEENCSKREKPGLITHDSSRIPLEGRIA